MRTTENQTGQSVTAAELKEARGWIADCWGTALARKLTRDQVIAGIARHYDGGWAGFRADSASVTS